MATEKTTSNKKRSSAPKAAAPKRVSASEAASSAARQLLQLIDRDYEGITGIERRSGDDEDGWTVQVDVLEMMRVPDTTDLLATYEVDTDSDGELLAYRRVRRYIRGEE
ncbi:hypothetical protein GCM10011492_27530 [Flexivirga endophytica]|uniref:Gas vesicle protein n=1 Tax=Flexivirga endophytica TaxID=1849103 RepID=A0A916T877_9MICO|nr:gas vesicle protein GvpO [Flexivirga endophytica]GGB35338.1 hypothetical protein GCM10011492_27530 [Flexivirga endophytica]GHB43128.1 hypothetical protein GCM10008112_09910 [Flexivirga endophytica]